MADPKGFFENINGTEAGQFVALAANLTGFGSVLVQLTLGTISLFNESDTDKILNAISQLQAQLQMDFAQLGDLIKQQTQIITQTVNRDAMATALAHTDTGLFSLNTFVRTKNDADLRVALAESSEGVQFFLNLGQTPPDVFFMPGLVKAGTTRIAVIVMQDPSFFTSRPDYVDEIHQMVALLGSMIDLIKSTIDAAHTVNQKSHSEHCSPLPQSPVPEGLPPRTVFVIDGYDHEENGAVLEFFDAQQGNPPCEQPSGLEEGARSAAIQARNQGVADELAFMGIPGFEAVLQNWKTVVHEA